jgi:phage terminase large subunit-like protein
MPTAEVGTLEHFKRWAHELILDTGDHWLLEPFQEDIVRDFLSGFSEVWTIVPEGNGKTTLLAGIALYHADHVPTAFVPIGASSREQAEIMYRQAEGFVIRTPGMRAKSKQGDTGFVCQEGYRRVKVLHTGARIQVYAADDRTADGVIPTLAILDELHRHRNLRLYRTWRGKLEKRGGQIVTISTAGEPESEFEETRAKIIADATTRENGGPRMRAVGEDIVLHDWAVRDRTLVDDMDAVAAANPRVAITAEVLRKKRKSPTMTDAHWLRFVCDIAARESGQAILPEEWDRLALEGYEPSDCYRIGFIDLGWRIDCTGLGVLFWESDELRVAHDVKVLEPPVNETDIVKALVDRQRRWNPAGWVFDPNAGGAQMAQLLEKGEHPHQGDVEFNFIEHSQDNAPMALAATRMDEAIRARWFRHTGDPDFRKHALNTVRKSLGGEKWKYDRPPEAKGERRQKYPIDAFTGVLMGHSVAVAEMAAKPVETVHFA